MYIYIYVYIYIYIYTHITIYVCTYILLVERCLSNTASFIFCGILHGDLTILPPNQISEKKHLQSQNNKFIVTPLAIYSCLTKQVSFLCIYSW